MIQNPCSTYFFRTPSKYLSTTKFAKVPQTFVFQCYNATGHNKILAFLLSKELFKSELILSMTRSAYVYYACWFLRFVIVRKDLFIECRFLKECSKSRSISSESLSGAV